MSTKDIGLDIAGVVHDMRGYLHVIGSYSRLCESRIKNNASDEDVLYCLTSISGVQVELNQLVDNILEVSQKQEPQCTFNISYCDIRQLIVDVILRLAPLIDIKKLKVDIKQSTIKTLIKADPSKIRRVVVNIITNAIKFADRGTSIEISFEEIIETTKHVAVSVKNTGQVIPKDKHEKIFDPVFQIEKGYKGSGLGLAISKQIVEDFNGKIWVDDCNDGGKFTFSLPI